MKTSLGNKKVNFDGKNRTITELSKLKGFKYYMTTRRLNGTFFVPHKQFKNLRPPEVEIYFDRRLQSLGLRAKNRIKAGTFLLELTGKEVKVEDLDAGKYAITAGKEGICIDASDCGNEARFINHKCENANCDAVYYNWSSRVFIRVNKEADILPGTPLTMDYGKEYGDIEDCRCASHTHNWKSKQVHPQVKKEPEQPEQQVKFRSLRSGLGRERLYKFKSLRSGLCRGCALR